MKKRINKRLRVDLYYRAGFPPFYPALHSKGRYYEK